MEISLRRVGVGPGWTVIDCGCGPIGGLAILAEMVGPAGRVVGVDFSEPTIQYARSVMAALGLENVELVAGDIHELDAATLGGPFDLAFTRAFSHLQLDADIRAAIEREIAQRVPRLSEDKWRSLTG